MKSTFLSYLPRSFLPSVFRERRKKNKTDAYSFPKRLLHPNALATNHNARFGPPRGVTRAIAKNASWRLLCENFQTLRHLRLVHKWLKVDYVWVILRTRPGICFEKLKLSYLRPLRRWLKVVYVWVILLVHHSQILNSFPSLAHATAVI